MNPRIFRAFTLGFGSLMVVGIALSGFLFWQNILSPVPAGGQEALFEVKKGASFSGVASDLERQRLIRSARWLTAVARMTGLSKKVKAGEYALPPGGNAWGILLILSSGKSREIDFTVAEGWNIFEIAKFYEDRGLGSSAEFLSVVRSRDFIQELLGENRASLEGYLFPETYRFRKGTTAREIVTFMVRQFFDAIRSYQRESWERLGLTRHQFVTLASIVEKETGAPPERPLISSVFHNRLKKRMRLQTDPTVLYGKALETGKMIISITRKDLQTPGPYNTYLISGLPPGPIANPGRAALEAALKPAQTRYLYFVSRNEGTHVFSESYSAHSRAVREFQLNPKARQGKSWRDLQK